MPHLREINFTAVALWVVCTTSQLANAQNDIQVKVFSIQKNLWGSPGVDTFLSLNLTMTEAQAVTICYRYRFFRRTSYDTVISYSVASKPDYIVTGYAGDIYFPCIQQVCQSFPGKWDEIHILDRWYSECVAMGSDMTIQLFRDGKDLGVQVMALEQSEPILLNGTLFVGQEQDYTGGGFTPMQSFVGDVAQINMWSYRLADRDIFDFLSCAVLSRGNVFSTDVTEFLTKNVVEGALALSKFCKKGPAVVILPIAVPKRVDGHYLCHLYNMTHHIPGNQEVNDDLHKVVIRFRDQCWANSNYLWLAGADLKGNGEWRNTETGQFLEYKNFFSGFKQYNLPKCIIFRDDGSWVNQGCAEATKLCTPCEVGLNHYLYLRGLCELYEFRTRYQMVGYLNQHPFFKNHFIKIIYWHPEKNTWLLFDTLLNQTIATMLMNVPDEYPIGRHRWRLSESVCDRPVGEVVVLSLSKCTKDEFMCSSGDCIAKELRCNLRDDCADTSDEEGCRLISFGKMYRNNQPAPSNDTEKPLLLETLIKILRFSDINDKEMNLNIDLTVTLSWFESRAEYRNLNDMASSNVLSKDDGTRLWAPKLSFKNIHNGHMKILNKIIRIKPQGPAKPYNFNEESLDTVYPGSSGNLSIERQYIGTFSCEFELTRYPFDEQTCTLDAALASGADSLVTLDEERLWVEYTGDPKLNNYLLKEMDVMKTSDDSGVTGVKVSFVLERRYSLVVVSTFVPCLLLLGIGYTSLFIRLSLFMPRIMVSLTTLLVFYTLFNQVSSVLPSTAYVKVIDMWFFMCMSLLFVIIIAHVVIDHLPSENDVVKFDEDNDWESNFTSERMGRVARFFAVPGIVMLMIVTVAILYQL